MTLIHVSLAKLQMFFLIFLRVAAILMTLPLFDTKNIPIIFKVGLALSVSILIYPLISLNNTVFTGSIISFGIGIAGEVILGMTIGLAVKLVFAGFQLAGQLIGVQMGFGMARVMDPVSGSEGTLVSQFNNIVAMLIFLAINAHHWFLRALVDSFELIPLFQFKLTGSLMTAFVGLSTHMFIIAIKVGAPIIVALLLTTVAFGLIARTVPQMNVFIVAMPLKIIVGLFFLGFSIPYLGTFFKEIFSDLGRNILLLLKIMA
jgi:flagellar biosynthetic protein FliR